MFTIGLSGGIGSGKTSVAMVFENLRIPVYYADSKAKYLMNSNSKLRIEIEDLLGKEAYKNNVLQREYIAKKVFSNNELLSKLNSLVHPAVYYDFLSWKKEQNSDIVIQENALMFLSDSYKKFDKTIYVYCPENIRIQRVCKRDNISKEQVLERIKKQASDEDCIAKADYVITNNSTLIIPQILEVYNNIKEIIYG